MLTKLISSKVAPYLFVGAGVLIVFLFSSTVFLNMSNNNLRKTVVSYELALDASVKISNKNEKELIDYKKESTKQFKQLEISHAKKLERQKRISYEKGRILNVKKSDDGSISIVLANTLKRLQSEQSSIRNKKAQNRNTK